MRNFFWDTLEAANIAWGALKSSKVRSALATLGIIIGVMTVVLMITIVIGLNTSFQKQISALGANTLYIQRFPWLMQDDFFIFRNRPLVTMKDCEAIRRESKLAVAVTPLIFTSRPVKFGPEVMPDVTLLGTDENYVTTANVEVDVGRFLTTQDCNSNRSVAVIGTDIADKIFRQRNPIGQSLRIGAYEYHIVGILKKRGTMFGESLDTRVILPWGTVLQHFGHRRDINVIAKAAAGVSIEDLKDELTGILRRSRKIPPNKPDNFSLNEQAQLMNFYEQITWGVYAAGILIGGISLLVGGIGIMNIMLVSVTERTHEIGIRKALGARRSQVLRQFLIESALICLMGGLIGTGLAWGGGKLITQWLPVTMPLHIALGGTLFATLVGVFFGLYPAAKASRLDPIIALRKE
jgi:putative ABC transport system permease protein